MLFSCEFATPPRPTKHIHIIYSIVYHIYILLIFYFVSSTKALYLVKEIGTLLNQLYDNTMENLICYMTNNTMENLICYMTNNVMEFADYLQ